MGFNQDKIVYIWLLASKYTTKGIEAVLGSSLTPPFVLGKTIGAQGIDFVRTAENGKSLDELRLPNS